MTREELKKNIRSLFYSSETVEKYLEKAYTLIDQIYNDHEVQLKAKDEEIEKLKKLVNDFNNTYSVGDFDFESYYAITNNFECAIREIDRLEEQKHNG